MQIVALKNLFRNRYLQAVISGVLLAATFPKIGLAGAAWIAPALILFAACGARPGEAFRIGYVAGLAHYLVSLYWLLFIPFPVGAVAGWLALSSYLAFYPAIWVWLCWKIFPGRRENGLFDFLETKTSLKSTVWSPGSGEGSWSKTAPAAESSSWSNAPWLQRALWSFLCAVIWVALEMIIARMLAGFPWNLLGASQYQILPVIQIASITGVYGVSFVIVWFAVALVCAILALLARPTCAKAWLSDLIIPLLVVVATVAYGVQAISSFKRSGRFLKVALVQPSIPQTLIWDPKEDANRFQQLLKLSQRALEEKPDLLVWPEAAVPNMLRYEPESYEAVASLATKRQVWLIVGSDDLEPRSGATDPSDVDYYNSSFLISPDGKLRSAYRKQKLVIFGEYIPLVRWLPFMKYLTPIGAGFTPGGGPIAFRMPELGSKTSVLICFEDTFPHLARSYVEPDTDFLLNLTNNGWFGESAAQWQHAASAVFRAVENRAPLVRCANNGLTCWVDSLGGMHDIEFPDSKNVYGAGFKIATVPLLPEGELRQPTFYNRHGDWFGWSCVAVTLGLIGQIFIRRKQALKTPLFQHE